MSKNSKRWEKSGDICPTCGKETEYLVDDLYVYKERCKKCGWENTFLNEEASL